MNKKQIFRKAIALCLAALMAFSLAAVAMADGSAPLLSGNRLYAKGTAVTIEQSKKGGVDIFWQGGSLHYAGNDLTVFGGAAGGSFSHITLESGTVAAIYGGSENGWVGQTVVLINSGWVDSVYGGGLNGSVENARVVARGGNIGEIYGGGAAGAVTNAELVANGGIIGRLYGGGKTGSVANAEVEIGAADIKCITAGGKYGSLGSGSVALYLNSRVDDLQGCYGGSTNQVKMTVYKGSVGRIGAGALEEYEDSSNCGVADCTITLNNGKVGRVYGGSIAAGGLWSSLPAANIRVNLSQEYGYGKLEESLIDALEGTRRLKEIDYDIDEEIYISVDAYKHLDAYEEHWDDVVEDLYDLRAGQQYCVDYDEDYKTIPVGVLDHVRDSGVTLVIEKAGIWHYVLPWNNLPTAEAGRAAWGLASLENWKKPGQTA